MNSIQIPTRSNHTPAPVEQTVLGSASELSNFISTLESHVYDLNSMLFGEGSSAGDPRPMPTTLQGLIADASERTACLCGSLATLKGRLGAVNGR